MIYSTKEKTQESFEVDEQEVKLFEILLFNDEVNTFDFVIDSPEKPTHGFIPHKVKYGFFT